MAEEQEPLTEEDKRDAIHFMVVYRDPTSWTSWENKKEQIKKQMPDLWRAWKNYSRALEDLLEFKD